MRNKITGRLLRSFGDFFLENIRLIEERVAYFIYLKDAGDIKKKAPRWVVVMKRLLISLLAVFIVSTASVEAEPEYAKWSAVAVKETQKRYKADIIDYKHIGRLEITPKKSEERFKLWLRSKVGNEFGVYVFIQFDPSTDVIYSIRFIEANGYL